MNKIAFKMKLNAGQEEVYRKRHDEIWPDLVALLNQSGVSDYSIFLDESSSTLFGVLTCTDRSAFNKLPESPVMLKWWQYMKDIMETNPDGSPVSIPLKEVFYLP